MTAITPDIFEEFINEGHFEKIDNTFPLYAPLLSLKIKRDKKLQLLLTTTSDSNSKSDAIEHPAGTVRLNNDSIELTDISGIKVKLNGVQPLSYNVSTDSNGYRIRTELSSVNSIEATVRQAETGKFLIEWLENVDDGHNIWPDIIKTNIENNTLISLESESNKIEIKMQSDSREFGRKCIYLSIGDHKLYLVSSKEDKKSVGVKSGYILYLGTPSKEERDKIRNSLSFVLGHPLIRTGYSIFNSEWNLVSFKNFSAYSMNGIAFEIPYSPPAPLSKEYQNGLDEKIISPLVNSIYKNYDNYKFEYLSWAYWHAVCAPIHIAALHFGACIESLQNSHIKNNEKIFQTALIEKSKWKKLKNGFLKTLDDLETNEQEGKVLQNKISSLNQTPQSILTERFFNNLGIQFSQKEMKAWQQRNNAAHGNELKDGGEIELIREIKILKVLFHRVFLKIIDGGEYYIDYCSIDFPIKFITDSINSDPQ